MSRVLFVCVQNAGRSQMAEALFAAGADGKQDARSAGSAPAEHVHPEVVEVMRELRIDLEGRVPQARARGRRAGGCRRHDGLRRCLPLCPYIPGKRYIDWDLTDPHGLPINEVRGIRDEIAKRTSELAAELDSAADPK